jgi:hypothetical protein
VRWFCAKADKLMLVLTVPPWWNVATTVDDGPRGVFEAQFLNVTVNAHTPPIARSCATAPGAAASDSTAANTRRYPSVPFKGVQCLGFSLTSI